jgi:hypothetical protein
MRFSGMRAASGVPGGRLPDFIIIGAAKCGTTTLWRNLQRHPDVFMAEPKEPEFFSRDDRYALGLESYKAIFAPAGENMICGEASTTYTRAPHFGDVAGRMADAVPDARLIYLMRHPVERTYSNYRHRMRLDVPRMTFEEALDADPIFIDTSLYMMQIERYLARFPREALHCVLLEDLKRDPASTMRGVLRHIGAREVDVTSEGAVASNTAASGADDFARQRLRRIKRFLPGYHRVKGAIPDRWKDAALAAATRSPLGRKIKQGYQPSPLTPETRAMLLQRFAEPNRELAAFLGRDLAEWSS